MNTPAIPVHPDVKFLAQFYWLAVATEKEFGVPAWVTLAQHILEGGRENKNRFFNYFGVKAGGKWTGKTQDQQTWEWHKDNTHAKAYGADFISMSPYQGGFKYLVRQRFRAYDSPLEAYRDHARFLRVNPTYTKHGCFEPGISAAEFCRRMAAAGYATDNQYANKLVALVEQLKKKIAAGALSAGRAAGYRPVTGSEAAGGAGLVVIAALIWWYKKSTQ